MIGWLVPLAVACFLLAIFAVCCAISAAENGVMEPEAREFIVKQSIAGAWAAFICGVGAIILLAAGATVSEVMCIGEEPVDAPIEQEVTKDDVKP